MSLVLVEFEPEVPKWYIQLRCTCQCAVSRKMLTRALRIATFIIFISATVSISWNSICALLIFIGALLLPDYTAQAKPIHKRKDKTENPLKGKPRIKEAELSTEILHEMEHNICKFVTYNAEEVESLQNFELIQSRTECIFAKKARLWGSPDWKEELNLEENVLRSIPTFYKFTALCGALGLDGFVYELPGEQYGASIEVFGESVCKLLTTLSDNDPIEVHCMDKSYVGKRGWVFEFNKQTFFITTFAPCYPEHHSRYAFQSEYSYILLQPEISFAQHDLVPDTPHTNWDVPRTVRDRIRCAYRDAGRQYPIRDTIHYPMAHDIVRPLEDNGHVVEWWSSVKKVQYNHYKPGSSRIRTQSSCL